MVFSTLIDLGSKTNCFNTASVESVIRGLTTINPDAVVLTKLTSPVEIACEERKLLGIDNLIFSPVFLRRGRAFFDNLYPIRIVVGEQSERAETFANLLVRGAFIEYLGARLVGSTAAELINPVQMPHYQCEEHISTNPTPMLKRIG